MTKPTSPSFNPYPVTFEVERPANMSRPHVFLRILILVLASWIVGTGGWLGLVYLGLPAAAAILIARKNGQRYLDENGERVTGWIALILGALSYVAFLTDKLPGDNSGAVQIEIVRSGSPTVGSALLRILKAIPNALVLAVLGIVSGIVWLIAAISILLTEAYPKPLWNFQYSVIGRQARLLAYLASLVEPYPPFSLDGATQAPHTA
jgi:Domain of unknown function (DUF4389)